MSATQGPDPRQWEETTRWLHRVDEDLDAAEVLLASAEPLVDPAAFHCQQAAEKLAKAVLIAFGISPPRIHSVAQLSRLAGAQVPAIGAALEALGGLTAWYFVARYPDSESHLRPTLQEVRSALDTLRRLRRDIDALAPRKD